MRSLISSFLAFGFVQGVVAAPVNELPQVGYGTRFGECIGYCSKELQVIGRLVTFSATPQAQGRQIASVRSTVELNDSDFAELKRLAMRTTITGLPERVGCPDCTDGGAEWIALPAENNMMKQVTFEYGNPPSSLRELDLWLRKLQERFTLPPAGR